MSEAHYTLVDTAIGDCVCIRDLGPWDQYKTITNDAETVVLELVENGELPDDKRLFYYDSYGQLDEILHEKGKFKGIIAGPRKDQP